MSITKRRYWFGYISLKGGIHIVEWVPNNDQYYKSQLEIEWQCHDSLYDPPHFKIFLSGSFREKTSNLKELKKELKELYQKALDYKKEREQVGELEKLRQEELNRQRKQQEIVDKIKHNKNPSYALVISYYLSSYPEGVFLIENHRYGYWNKFVYERGIEKAYFFETAEKAENCRKNLWGIGGSGLFHFRDKDFEVVEVDTQKATWKKLNNGGMEN